MVYDLIGVRRNPEFSPNHVTNDWMILKLTAEEFSKRGYTVGFVDEAEIERTPIASPVILNMCQGAQANRVLQEVEANGCLIINQPGSVLCCHRYNLVSRLMQAGIPFPRSFIVATKDASDFPEAALAFGRVWIKRGDVHATGPNDVVLIDAKREEIVRTLHDFHQRGIAQAILQEHIEGQTIKFYAIQQDGFFRWYPLNGSPTVHLDEQKVYHLAEASAAALGLQIYGGDAINTADGRLVIIDMNDWPSFARFREAAAGAIAQHILRKAKAHDKL
jgi:glutathione synthase/RimK-type ligase-like ATP-grasp enzyme